MAELEPGLQGQERYKIVLLQGDTAKEIIPASEAGIDFLHGVRATLEAGIKGGLVETTSFEQLEKRSTAPAMVTAERTLELVTTAHRAKPYSPELLSEFNQAFWEARRERMGVSKADLAVSQAPYTEDQIRDFGDDFGLCIPQVVSTAPKGLILLGKADPTLGNWAFAEGTTVQNIDKDGNPINLHGWMKTEEAIDAPFTRTNQDQAEKIVRDQRRIGHTLNVYDVVSQQSKLLAGQYLDEVRTYIRVLSSRDGGRVLYADFYPDGYCNVHWLLKPDYVHDYLGVRSVEVAKA